MTSCFTSYFWQLSGKNCTSLLCFLELQLSTISYRVITDKLVMFSSLRKPVVKAPAEETSLPGRLKKLREKKSVKRIVVEKQKSDNMLSTRGHMFKVQAQFSGKESTIKFFLG